MSETVNTSVAGTGQVIQCKILYCTSYPLTKSSPANGFLINYLLSGWTGNNLALSQEAVTSSQTFYHPVSHEQLMTGPRGNSECWSQRPPIFPSASPRRTLRSGRNKTQSFRRGRSLSVIPPTSKTGKNSEEIVCLTPAGAQICCGFKEHELITCESKVQAVVSPGS